MELVLPINYDVLDQEEMMYLEGGWSSLKDGFIWLVKKIAEYIIPELIAYLGKHTINKAQAWVDAKLGHKKVSTAWARELNRHRYCCAGNAMHLGCAGR